MKITLAALSADQRRTKANPDDRKTPKVDYPKSEPVLESSYVFPKEKRYAEWRFSAPGAVAVPEDC